MRILDITWLALACVQAQTQTQGKDLGDVGSFVKWAKMEQVFRGPPSQGVGKPNPFATVMDVVFRSPSGKQFSVPGFYDGDGKENLDGNRWKVRFAADELGRWIFSTRSASPELDGYTGSFTATPVPDSAADFYRWGRLEAVGTAANKFRYLKFRDGPFWLKAGCDDPENFLGHYSNYNTNAKRKAAVDYLSERGINSLYLMTHNIGGDDNDVWPWLGKTAKEAKVNGGADSRFDIARLEEWRDLFEYMQGKGMVVYIVLEDDSAWKGYDHGRYYREIIARFGYLPALIFNFNEEHNENYSLTQALGHMQKLGELDPYNHPRGIHNVNKPTNDYVDAAQLDFTSIQTKTNDPLMHHKLTIDWIDRCRARGRRILVVNHDEGRPEHDRKAWWSAYLAGGVWEAHILPPYNRPMSAWEPVWQQLGGARTFMESLPFWEMEPSNVLVKTGKAFCLARPGEAYAVYLPAGGDVTLDVAEGPRYECKWWKGGNDRTGRFVPGGEVPGGRQSFTAPAPGDWALRIARTKEKP